MNTFAFIQKFKTALPLITALLCLTALTAFSQKPEIYVSTGHSATVSTVAFSPDGKTLASGSRDNTIRLWDVRLGQEFKVLTGHSGNVNSIAFSPDGKTLASGSEDNTIRLWDVNSGRELKVFFGSIRSIAFSPDGKTLASGMGNYAIKLWDVVSGQESKTLIGHSDLAVSVAFSPDGNTLVSGGFDKVIRLWDAATGQQLKTFNGHSDRVYSVAFGSDGKTLASVSADNTIRSWDVASGQELIARRGHSQNVSSVAFSSDGKTLVSANSDRSVKLWDMATGRELKTLNGFLTSVTKVVCSPDCKTLAIVHGDRTIKIWDVASGQEIKTLKSHSNDVGLVAFSPDGKMLASLTRRYIIKLWDVASGQELKTLKLTSDHYWVNSVAFSSNGGMFASGNEDGTIKLWNVASGQDVKTLTGLEMKTLPAAEMKFSEIIGRSVMAVAFIEDDRVLASVHRDSTIRLWDVGTGQELKTFKGHDDYPFAVAFSPDGKILAINAISTKLLNMHSTKLLDVSSGRELKSFNGPAGSLSFSPDGKTLATGDRHDSMIKLWNVVSGQELKTLSDHSGNIGSVSFSPDGETLASVSIDKTIKLWNVASGLEIKTLMGHSNRVNSISFSRDGKTLASGSGDATTKLWDVTSGDNIASLIALDEKDWAVVTPDGRFDGSPDGMKLISYVQDNKLLPLDSFFEQFFTPNLLQKVYARETLPTITSKVDFSKRIKLPPVVRITSSTPGAEPNTDAARIVVEAKDQGGGVEDIRLYQNGKLIGDATRQLAQDTTARTRTFEVSLLPGVNTFRATAFNTDRTEATPDEIKIELKALEATANLYILAVGLNKYKNENYDLNYGRPDAQAFADAVEQHGHGIFKQITKKVLFDVDATNGGIEAAFNDVIKEAKPQDVFVFYFAGHGAMSEGDEKTASDFYLVPYDVVKIFGDSGSLMSNGIAARDLREMLKKVRALKQLIILDACQSGGAVETIAMRGPAEEKAIMQLARSAGVAVLASAGSTQSATEFSKLGHGVFTYALLEGLNGKADGAPLDGKITVMELAAYINNEVPELTKLYRGKRQDPNSSTRGQDFPIAIKQ